MPLILAKNIQRFGHAGIIRDTDHAAAHASLMYYCMDPLSFRGTEEDPGLVLIHQAAFIDRHPPDSPVAKVFHDLRQLHFGVLRAHPIKGA